MGEVSSFSLGRLLLHIAVGVMLAVGGIWGLQGGGDAAIDAIRNIFNGDVAKILVIVFSVIEILAGIFLLLELFIGERFGTLDTILMLIVMIVWIVAIVLSDFLGSNGILNGGANHFLRWLYSFAQHLIILGAMVCIKK